MSWRADIIWKFLQAENIFSWEKWREEGRCRVQILDTLPFNNNFCGYFKPVLCNPIVRGRRAMSRTAGGQQNVRMKELREGEARMKELWNEEARMKELREGEARIQQEVGRGKNSRKA